MNFINSIIYALGILFLISGIDLGLKTLYAFIRTFSQKRKASKKQMERARFVKDVRTEVRNYLKELQK